MKNLRNKIFLPFITCILLALFSCVRETNFIEEEDKAIILMSLNGTQTRGADLFTDDDLITKVRVVIFTNDYVEKNLVFTSGEDAFENPFRVEVATGSKTVYVVANETSAMVSSLENVQTMNSLESLLADNITQGLPTPLVMTGKTEDVDVVANTVNNTSVTLTRVAAKISLSFVKDTDAEVKITKISLINNTGMTPLYEGGATISGQSYWNHVEEYTGASSVLLEETLPDDPLLTLYVYENLSGAEDKDNAAKLEVEALYNNIPTTYRVFVNEQVGTLVNPGDPSSSTVTPDEIEKHYKIERNHYYKLTGTIKNIGIFDGMTLQAVILPWSYLLHSISFEHTYTIDPYPTFENRTYTVDNTTDEVSFTFTLTNPIDANWIANLSNPTDFEIVDESSGLTDDTVVLTIRPKAAQRTTERSTELYISVNYGGYWMEIPLLQGQATVGTGNRIVIVQPAAQ